MTYPKSGEVPPLVVFVTFSSGKALESFVDYVSLTGKVGRVDMHPA